MITGVDKKDYLVLQFDSYDYGTNWKSHCFGMWDVETGNRIFLLCNGENFKVGVYRGNTGTTDFIHVTSVLQFWRHYTLRRIYIHLMHPFDSEFKNRRTFQLYPPDKHIHLDELYLSPDGKLLVGKVNDYDGYNNDRTDSIFYLWDLSGLECLFDNVNEDEFFLWKRYYTKVKCLFTSDVMAISDDHRYIVFHVFSNPYSIITIFDTIDSNNIKAINHGGVISSMVVSVSFLSENKRLAVGDIAGKVTVYDVTTKEKLYCL